ncbi:uncharacterized protein LOC107403651 isoform X1 [Ziziphus jujuba]|uniref:Uncharacterized protein LOC107403651 isoform X1 n=2 Tax=Ziziphus jujuba TaxID=326968 RepID=A0ABM3IBR2_ZIZJJ|nr:uncharacterized protein LOC107403651 isoform X1 [Ziziphus jujuba]
MSYRVCSGMGTKIEYAVNLLGTSPNSNSFTVHGVDDWNYFLNTGLKVKSRRSKLENKIHNFMDRMLGKHNVDSIRRTMQMHEDIFNYQTFEDGRSSLTKLLRKPIQKKKKLQVKELHRLYSAQKKLMSEVKKEITKQSRSWDPRINSTTTTTTITNSDHMNHSQFINWHNPNPTTPQFITTSSSANNFHIHTLREDFNSRERSGSCSGDTVRMSRGFDLERPAAEGDMSTGISAVNEDHQAAATASGLSSHNLVLKRNKMMTVMMSTTTTTERSDDEESEVELTLSIGSCLSKKKSKSGKPNQLDSSASFKADHRPEGDCSDPTTPMSSSSATFDQERKQPHWLFHGLKLK